MTERVFGTALLLPKDNIAAAETRDLGPAPSLDEGQALFAVERVALTANNVTYAAMGERMGYWRFFPGPAGFGILPVWGYARCVSSEADGISKGDRFYGYWPLAEQLLVETEQVTAAGFNDPSEHRDGLADIYNRYNRRDDEPDPATEAIEALHRPLFATGWLLARQLGRAQDYGAEQVLISSASSKTAIACAWTYAQRTEDEHRPEVIGLTSAANTDFVRGLGLYDRVYTYENLFEIADDRATIYNDFAGTVPFRRQVHERFGPRLNRSVAIGLTHWQETGPGEDVPPPESKLFFAPDAISDEIQTYGRSGYVKENEAAWDAFSTWVTPHTEVHAVVGLDEAALAYRDLAAGRIAGAAGLIVTP